MESGQRVRGSRPDLSDLSPIVSETDESITIRQPVRFYGAASINPSDSSTHLDETRAMVSRYKYYSKLDSRRVSSLLMPNHVVPPEFYLIIPITDPSSKQSSLVTIFSIWNTMMGTSILSIPWAIQEAGFATGLCIMVAMVMLTMYTASLVLSSPDDVPEEFQVQEFSDVCRYHLGRWGEWLSLVFSALALVGAAAVYWVLMSNFLFNSVSFIYHDVHHEFSVNNTMYPISDKYRYVQCANHTLDPPHNVTQADTAFHNVWSITKTVPLFLLVIILPLVNFKSPTFFTKFNALGTVSVLFVIGFVIYKSAVWGMHMDFHDTEREPVPNFNPHFPSMTGLLSLALFIHNCVISIMRNQRHPENNQRDLRIAYCCVGGTYMLVGTLFYCAFPLVKSCLADNLLNNLLPSDTGAFVARMFLFFQMVTVFPLIMYILRAQLLHAFCGAMYPGLGHVVLLNLAVLAVCVVFAVFLPQIGTIIRFSGALCGLAYIFTLPCVVYLLARRQDGTLTKVKVAVHVGIIALGVLNLVAQFILL